MKNAVTSTTVHESPLHFFFIQTKCLPFDLMNYSTMKQIREWIAKEPEIIYCSINRHAEIFCKSKFLASGESKRKAIAQCICACV